MECRAGCSSLYPLLLFLPLSISFLFSVSLLILWFSDLFISSILSLNREKEREKTGEGGVERRNDGMNDIEKSETVEERVSLETSSIYNRPFASDVRKTKTNTL